MTPAEPREAGPPPARPCPARLGSYELVRPLARGGMADIYLARHCGLAGFERLVALKVLDEARASEADATAMFLHEARVCALLSHHNIAAVLDVGAADEHHYIAMEYVDGVDLRDLVAAAARAGRAIPYETAIAIACGAAAGLDHAHRRCDAEGRPLRLVHRDISLSNVMVGFDGSVKVVDFGIATTAIASVHTMPGIVRGKASYMSPEQCLGERVDHRTDVFALGVVLYELTTGARCFQGKSDFARMLAVVRGEYTPPHQLVPDYPAELAAVVRRALAVSAADRYSSCAALIEALEGVLAARGWHGGTGAIARLVGELCGPGGAGRAATGADTDPTTSRISLPIEALATALASALALAAAPTAPRPVLGRGSARRLARGTSVEACDDRATRAPRALSHDDRAAPPPAEPPAGTTLRDALPRFAACAEGSLIEPLDDELEIPAGRSPGDPALEAAIDAAIDAASDAAASDAAASAPREAVRGAGAPARAQAERPPRLDTRGRPSPFDDDDEPTRGRRIAKRPGSVVV